MISGEWETKNVEKGIQPRTVNEEGETIVEEEPLNVYKGLVLCILLVSYNNEPFENQGHSRDKTE